MTLTISVRQLAYRKVAGALAGTLPLLAYFLLGVVLVPDKTTEFFNDLGKDPEGFMFLTVAGLQFILFLHLTAYLSLVLKRGALPLAIAIQYMGGSFLLGLVSAFLFTRSGGAGAASVFIGLICVLLTAALHFATGSRLTRAAAEE